MSLFGKKKEEKKCCACAEASAQVADENRGSAAEASAADSKPEAAAVGVFNVKVLGGGCAACHRLWENAQAACDALGIDVKAEYITDMEKVMSYGVMSMPALVVNDRVVSSGKVLKPEAIELFLKA